MGRPLNIRLFINCILICSFPASVFAITSGVPLSGGLYLVRNVIEPTGDSTLAQKQDDKKVKDKDQKKGNDKKERGLEPEIKQVPKARRQAKPLVIKPVIKVKPIKVIRPRIKRP